MFNLRGLDYFFALSLAIVPLGIWKLIEIIVWAWSHITFGAKS